MSGRAACGGRMDVQVGQRRMPVVPDPREDLVAWALTSRETGEVVIWQVPNLPSVVAQASVDFAALATGVTPRHTVGS